MASLQWVLFQLPKVQSPASKTKPPIIKPWNLLVKVIFNKDVLFLFCYCLVAGICFGVLPFHFVYYSLTMR